MDDFDVAIVGGGIIGLATAHAVLEADPTLNVVVLEKERRVAAHQSGRNSGVLHSGIYYRPGSLKARLAVAGRESMVSFCTEHGAPFEICGKVIIALDEEERTRLLALSDRARANGVRVQVLQGDRIRALEPHARGVAALHVPDAGDFMIEPSGVRSTTYGTLEFLTPIAELKIEKVTPSEAEMYSRWRDGYQALCC